MIIGTVGRLRVKGHLADADGPRRNDLDGRRNLSEGALAEFARFFLSVCIDQVAFMESLVQPERLRARIVLWAEEEVGLGALPAKSTSILEVVLYRGELPRGDTAGLIGASEKHARRIVSALMERGVLTADSACAVASRFFSDTSATLDAGIVPRRAELNVTAKTLPVQNLAHT